MRAGSNLWAAMHSKTCTVPGATLLTVFAVMPARKSFDRMRRSRALLFVLSLLSSPEIASIAFLPVSLRAAKSSSVPHVLSSKTPGPVMENLPFGSGSFFTP